MPVTAQGVQPEEALAFWRAKVQLTPKEYSQLTQQARSRAFAVSGLHRREEIAAVHEALGEAIANGETLEQFKAKLGPLLEKKGWTGPKAWRVENIYRTNLQSAYQAGRYAQLMETAKRRPFWRYLAVRDRRTRPTHLALHGKVYPADHEFWSVWYPPNGFQCRCTVQSLSAREVAAKGLKVEDKVPRLVEPPDPATGAPLPARPLHPDPGWGGNVGRDWLSGLTPRELEGELKDLATGALCRDGKGLFADDICRPPLASIDRRHIHQVDAKDILPKGLKDEEYVGAFLKEFGLMDLGGSTVHRLPGDIPVVVSKELFLDKASNQFKVNKDRRWAYMKLLARTLLDPFEIWHVPVSVAQAGRRAEQRDALRVIALFETQGKDLGGYVAFNLMGNVWQGSTAMVPKNDRSQKAIFDYLERMRQGTLIYRRP
ncbi:MAG: minor capsid protein [Deltaproteobacteria bacterium]|nr:minor capsid protein [Deltaproteobacteria bacterium]